jgi:LuxR family maltose regulon positive regulatory protein
MMAVQAAMIFSLTSRPAEAERWADAVDRWQYGDRARPSDPATEAMAVLLRAALCRRGAEQMRADADEAAHRFGAEGGVQPSSAVLMKSSAALFQGIARFLCGDLDDADAYWQDAVSMGEAGDVPETVAVALAERSLLAMARNQWDQAGTLADQAGAVLRPAGIEVLLACAAQARTALHRGDVQAARRELLSGQRCRHLLTYAVPHQAVQARIELARVHVALADLSGARTLMREIDEILRRRPELGILASQARQLRTQLAKQSGTGPPGASALTGAELRVLPLLATHLSYAEIAAELFLSPNTIKSQAYSLYRKLGASSRSQAVARSRELALLEG